MIMFDFINNAKKNLSNTYGKTAKEESRYFPQAQAPQAQAPQAPQALGTQPQQRLNPMANVNAQRSQPQARQVPSALDQEMYDGAMNDARTATDWIQANQEVPQNLRNSIDRVQKSFGSKYPSFEDANLQAQSTSYLNDNGYYGMMGPPESANVAR